MTSTKLCFSVTTPRSFSACLTSLSIVMFHLTINSVRISSGTFLSTRVFSTSTLGGTLPTGARQRACRAQDWRCNRSNEKVSRQVLNCPRPWRGTPLLPWVKGLIHFSVTCVTFPAACSTCISISLTTDQGTSVFTVHWSTRLKIPELLKPLPLLYPSCPIILSQIRSVTPSWFLLHSLLLVKASLAHVWILSE